MSRFVIVAACVAILGCSNDGADPDASTDAPAACRSDDECSDGQFCNGEERCDPGEGADARGCRRGANPCPMLVCDEDARECGAECPDVDGDGARDVACGGTDCDDTDDSIFPGATEVCDASGIDEDCDPSTLAGIEGDTDGDGFVAERCCNGATCGTDCDDEDRSINPGAVDACGGGDQDCDGSIDENPDETFYRDRDRDGYGDPSMPLTACAAPDGYAPLGTDCNDELRSVNPATPERCETAFDDNCDGAENEGCGCPEVGLSRACGSTEAIRNSVGECRAGTQTCQAVDGGTAWGACLGERAPVSEACNDRDDDCDTRTDEDFECRTGAMETGTNACGRTGSRTCLSCLWTPPDFAAAETAGSCDYCDDTGTGSLAGEQGFATTDARLTFVGAGVTRLGDATSLGSDGSDFLVGSWDTPRSNRVGGIVLTEAQEIGYGTVTFDARMQIELNTSGECANGWAMVVARSSGSPFSLGSGGDGLGVPLDRDGFAVEWRFYDEEVRSNETDSLVLRHLRASGPDPLVAAFERPTQEAFRKMVGSGYRPIQHVRIRLTPDDPETGPNETSVLVEHGVYASGGTLTGWMEALRCGPATTSCPFRVSSGETYFFALTGAAEPASRPVIFYAEAPERVPFVDFQDRCP